MPLNNNNNNNPCTAGVLSFICNLLYILLYVFTNYSFFFCIIYIYIYTLIKIFFVKPLDAYNRPKK